MSKLIAILAAFAALGLASMPASASHIYVTNITIEGSAVAAGGSFVNPTITVNQGDLIDFSFDLFGDTDTFSVTFSGVPFLTNQSTVYGGTGTMASPVNFSFSQVATTIGTFTGMLVPDLVASFPDYMFPNGNTASEPPISFTLNVTSANDVPEPASLALCSLGILGMAAARRRRRA